MNEKKLLILFIAVTSILLFGGVIFVSSSTSTPQVTASQNVKASVNQDSFDWGNIPYAGEKATKTFTIKNPGTDVLKLMNIKTSCHCTKASVTIDGKESPSFGMDGLSSWVGEVSPGKEATLTVVFDQAFHGESGIGPVERYVSLETNDPRNSKLTFTLTGTVVK